MSQLVGTMGTLTQLLQRRRWSSGALPTPVQQSTVLRFLHRGLSTLREVDDLKAGEFATICRFACSVQCSGQSLQTRLRLIHMAGLRELYKLVHPDLFQDDVTAKAGA